MSEIEEFYTTSFDLSRIASVVNTETDAMQVIASGIGCLQAVQDKTQLLNEADWGKEFWFFCKKDLSVVTALRATIGRTTNPVENDIMTINGANYGVVGVSEFADPFEATDAHLKIVITRRTSTNYNG